MAQRNMTQKSSTGDVISEINSVIRGGKVRVDSQEISIEMFLGGDYKLLLMVMGLEVTASDYSCL